MKIAICGAGMGGLTAACLLHDDGHEITIIDQFNEPRPLGSGLMVQPYGQRILQKVGALDAALQNGNHVKHMRGIEVNRNRPVLDETYEIDNDGAFGLAIHRSGLFDALYHATKKRDIQFETDFLVAEATSNSVISSDGKSILGFDLIVDALGAHSPLSPLSSKPLKFGAVWATVEWEQNGLPKDQLSQRYDRAEHMVGILPCGIVEGRDSAALFWSPPQSEFETFRAHGIEAWRKQAIALWPEIEPFAQQITDMEQFNFARYGHGTLFRPYNEKFGSYR